MTNTLLSTFLLGSTLVACADTPEPAKLALPGDSYYPESLNAADGTLYVGSLTTGEVVAFDDGSAQPRTVLAAGSDGVTGETGVLVRDKTLWICSIDTTFQKPTEIRSFDLHGTPIARYPLAANQFCNDLAFDGAGNLYATDSFSGTIVELPAGGSAVETFVQDARFAAIAQGAFGLDGIAYDGKGALYVGTLDTSRLFRVTLASGAIDEIAVTPALSAPDGIRVVDDHTLLVIEGGANRLSRVTVTGETAMATALSTTLDQPTSVVVARGYAWVSDGQINRLFSNPPQAPNLPFQIERVSL